MVEIKTILIFEMLGRPPEHLKDTLTKFINKLSQEKGIEVFNKKINDPKKIEEAQQEIYSTFAEVEADFSNINTLMNAIFTYMPSHIEITSPAELSLKNFEINSLSNEIARKLHQYDELAKRLMIEKQILEKQLQVIIDKHKENKVDEKQEEVKEKKQKKSKKK